MKSDLPWTNTLVNQVKADVKEELASIPESSHLPTRLLHILDRIRNLETDNSSLGRLHRYVLCVSALVHHERFGGLSNRQVDSISELALAILQAQKVDPATSRIGNLFGDVYLVRSQIYRSSGNSLQSAWDQKMSVKLSGRTITQGRARQDLASAIRVLRLGFAKRASQYLDRALEGSINDKHYVQTHMQKLRLLRLSGHFLKAQQLAEQVENFKDLSDSHLLEIAWERYCIRVALTNDLTEIVRVVGLNGTHRFPDYFMEAFLLVHATRETRWIGKLTTIKTMSRTRKGSLQLHKHGFIYQCVKAIEDCHDTLIPMHNRLTQLGNVLSQSHKLLTVDQELMVLAAGAVWLSRNRAGDLAQLTLDRYESISLNLSDGKNRDVLGIISHLYDKEWYEFRDAS